MATLYYCAHPDGEGRRPSSSLAAIKTDRGSNLLAKTLSEGKPRARENSSH